MLNHLRKLVALGITLVAAPLLAHDLWAEPSSFSPRPGQVVSVRLRVGVDLVGDPLPLMPARVKQFVVAGTAGRKPLAGRSGAEPAGAFRVIDPDLLVIGYHSHPSRVELAADKFNAYLAEEGLDTIVALRAQRGETGAAARELFARCAKSLVLVGPASEAQGDRRLGCPLELLAERNPYLARAAGEGLPLRLTYQEAPLAGALIVAMNSLNPLEKQSVRTDAEGRVRLRLRVGGMWLVKAVHMVPAPAGADADWASFWASMTFGRDQPTAE